MNYNQVLENKELFLNTDITTFSFNEKMRKILINRDEISTIEFRKTIFGW